MFAALGSPPLEDAQPIAIESYYFIDNVLCRLLASTHFGTIYQSRTIAPHSATTLCNFPREQFKNLPLVMGTFPLSYYL